MHAKSLQSCLTLCDAINCSPPGPSLSMGFSTQEFWSGLPCPPPGDLPDPGTESESPMFPALAGGFFTTSATWEAQISDSTWYLSFSCWLTLFSMIISHSIHVAANGIIWFLIFYGWVILYYIYALHLYPFICQRTFRLLPYFCYCK